jgi:hypothetical protein
VWVPPRCEKGISDARGRQSAVRRRFDCRDEPTGRRIDTEGSKTGPAGNGALLSREDVVGEGWRASAVVAV